MRTARSDSSPLGLTLFWGMSASACAAVVAATAGAWAILCWAPLNDPVDVVGVPLLRGYSERSETLAWQVFVVAAALFGFLVRIDARRIRLAPLFIFLIVAPGWNGPPIGLATIFLATAGGYRLGMVRSSWRTAAAAVAFCASPLLGSLKELPWEQTKFPAITLIAFCAGGFWATGRFRLRARSTLDFVRLPLAILSLQQAIGDFPLCGAAAAAVLLGGVARANGFQHVGWLGTVLAACAACWSANDWCSSNWSRPISPLCIGVGLGLMLRDLAPRPSPAFQFPVLSRLLFPRWSIRLPPRLFLIGTAPLAFVKPWFVGVLLLGLSTVRRGRPTSFAVGLATTLAVAALFPPARPGPQGLDPFHDGQTLSAVWEFESGRKLFSEVFPLREYEFWLAWIGRRLLPDGEAAYCFMQTAPDGLAPGGICLTVFLWTRSAYWSAAAALIAVHCGGLDGRQGVVFLLSAGAMATIALHPVARRASWAGLGTAAALLGFDCFVPFLAAAAAAALTDARRRRPLAAIRASASSAFWISIPFTVALCLWHGFESAAAFWSLLFDFAGNYPAFYGLPIPFNQLSYRRLLAAPAAAIAAWAAFGAGGRQRWSSWRFRAWLFLLVQTTLQMQRAVGRSDPSHLQAGVYPAVVLAALLLWEFCRVARRCGLSTGLRFRSALAGVAISLAAWSTAFTAATPMETLAAWRGMRDAVRWPAPTPIIQERVHPDQTLWDIEDGLANFVNGRHNPTRHALAYCICSPREQRMALNALQRRPPQLILWRYTSGADALPNPLRYYVLADYLFTRYQPLTTTEGRFLAPAPPNWRGVNDLPDGYTGSMALGWLAERWGRDRLPNLAPERMRPFALINSSQEWRCDAEIKPRDWNRLVLTAVGTPSGPEPSMELLFAPAGREWDASSIVSWRLKADGRRHTYLIPIGCSPGWSWRPAVDRIRIRARDCRADVENPYLAFENCAVADK